MQNTFSRVATLLLAVAIFLIGHGLQLTLLPVHALSAGWSGTAIGVTGAFYFVGFVTGCVLIPAIVARVGHIRSFMVITAIATAALLAAGLFVEVPAWILLRFTTGFAIAGFYMIVESWLTEVCPRERRGAILAIYLVISLVGVAIGQIPMMFEASTDDRLFMLGAFLLTMAIIPIGLTQIPAPRPIPAVRVTPGTLLRASRVAVVCAVFAGMVTGSFWTLGPVAGRSFELESTGVGLLMMLGILGGAMIQYPVGLLSDRMDRRLVIGLVTAAGGIVGIVAAAGAAQSVFAVYAGIMLTCAAAMPVYGLCIALAAEKTELSPVEFTGGMLLAHGGGSIIGPLIVAPAMTALGSKGFFVCTAAFMFAAATWTIARYFTVERAPDSAAHRPILPKTTQVVAGMLSGEPESHDGSEVR